MTTWRARFAEHRLAGLSDEPRPGRPRTLSDADVEKLTVTTLETKPKNATHWSTRSMAEHLGLSQTTVSRTWRASGLKPHLQDRFKLSSDSLFVDKLHDVVGLYLNPPEAAVVLCVDEKTQVQALDRTQPVFPMLPGTPSEPVTTTSGTAPPVFSPPSMSPPGRSSGPCTSATAQKSS